MEEYSAAEAALGKDQGAERRRVDMVMGRCDRMDLVAEAHGEGATLVDSLGWVPDTMVLALEAVELDRSGQSGS